MAWMVMGTYEDENEGKTVSKPRFPVSSSEDDANALRDRLNRCARAAYMFVQYPTIRRNILADYATWRAAGLTVLQTLDPAATYDVVYSVEEVGAAFAEPAAPSTEDPVELFLYALRDGDFTPPGP